ncbi:MAG: B12-binding domain-containing radical SAM protein [Acidobacteria bacterium]|nr:B12-binding domain-containing radical SAM protein [Acidobacteriota bacterium]
MGKKILLLHPKKETDNNPVPHLGLGILAAVLKKAGHRVRVLDSLLFIRSQEPELSDVLESYKPDIVGISIYTSTYSICMQKIESVRRVLEDVPLMAGGPHVTLNSEEMAVDSGIDYLFRGEAEDTIIKVVDSAARRCRPLVNKPDVRTLPYPDFSSFINYKNIRQYPLMTSRGCPYGCKFCAVKYITSRHWRHREPGDCVTELLRAKKQLPGLRSVKISDDSPTTRKEHFKDFLREYIRQRVGLAMSIDNMRADNVDRELVTLAKGAGVSAICIAAEHGHQEVFDFISKKESLNDIRRAAMTIKEGGLDLGLCFIIGLPKDNYRRTEESIRLAKELKPSYVFWNMAHPMKGTEIRRWYEENQASIEDDKDYTSFSHHSLRSLAPIVETGDFTRAERIKAYVWACLETDQYQVTFKELPHVVRIAARNDFHAILLKSLIRKTLRWPVRKMKVLRRKLLTACGSPANRETSPSSQCKNQLI